MPSGPASGVSLGKGSPKAAVLRTVRNDAESAPSFDAVSLKIIVVNCEDRYEFFSSGQVNECGISEIHRAVLVAVHQCFNMRQVFVFNGKHSHGAGTEKSPGGGKFMGAFQEVEELGKDRGRGRQW